MFINHVTLLIGDKKRSEEFYVGKLGLEAVRVGTSSLWIKVGDQFIHLTDNSGQPFPSSFYHFAIGVENLRPYLDRLIANGIEIFDFDDSMKKSSVNENLDVYPRQFFIRDPDGNLIEFHEAKNAYFLTGKTKE